MIWYLFHLLSHKLVLYMERINVDMLNENFQSYARWHLFSLYSFFLFSCWHIVTPFTLYAVLVYFQMNYGLLLYLKLARVDVGNISKKGKIWKVLLLEVFLLVGFLTELCLYIIFLSLFCFVTFIFGSLRMNFFTMQLKNWGAPRALFTKQLW